MISAISGVYYVACLQVAEALRVLPLLQSLSLTFGAACHLTHLLAQEHLTELRGELRVDARDSLESNSKPLAILSHSIK